MGKFTDELRTHISKIEARKFLGKAQQERMALMQNQRLVSEIENFAHSLSVNLLDFCINRAVGLTKKKVESNDQFTTSIQESNQEYDSLFFGFVNNLVNSAGEATSGNYAGAVMGVAQSTFEVLQQERGLQASITEDLVQGEDRSTLNEFGSLHNTLVQTRNLRFTIEKYFDRTMGALAQLHEEDSLSPCSIDVFTPRLDVSQASHEEIEPELAQIETRGQLKIENTTEFEQARNIILSIRASALGLVRSIEQKIIDEFKQLQKDLKQGNNNTDGDLVERVLGCFYASSHETASIHGMRDFTPATICHKYQHHRRGTRIAEALSINPSFRLLNLRVDPSSLERKALTAKLKRIAVEDTNSENQSDYRDSTFRISRAIDIIKIPQAKRTFKEKLVLLDDYILNAIDDAAYTAIADALIPRPLSCCEMLSFTTCSSTKHGYKKDDEICETLTTLFCSDELDNMRLLKRHIQTILQYYYSNLVTRFSALSDDPTRDKNLIKSYALYFLERELIDPTPSEYFHSPLTGLSKFIGNFSDKGDVCLTLPSDELEGEDPYLHFSDVFKKLFGDLLPGELLRNSPGSDASTGSNSSGSDKSAYRMSISPTLQEKLPQSSRPAL